MPKKKWQPITITYPVLLMLAWAGARERVNGGDHGGSAICCPVEHTNTVTKVNYTERVEIVCFPPSPFMILKGWLRLGPQFSGLGEPCCGQARHVHKLFKRTVRVEKCGVKYEPVLCPQVPTSAAADSDKTIRILTPLRLAPTENCDRP